MIYIQFAMDLTRYTMIYVDRAVFTLLGIVKAVEFKNFGKL